MRRSRVALTLFLSALAAGLQSAGFADVPAGMEPAPVASRRTIDCYADAPGVPQVRPVAYAENWYLDACSPEFDCYGSHGADCYHGPLANSETREPVLLDAEPIDEYEYTYEWDCEIDADDSCDVFLATPRVHLEDLSGLVADPRHSTGHDEVEQLNVASDGLPMAPADAGTLADDLPASEAAYMAQLAGDDRVSCAGDEFASEYSDEYAHDYGGSYCDEYADCNASEPEDLPPAEIELHVAEQAAPALNHDYEYDYGYDYAQYGDAPSNDSSYEDYSYDDYSYDAYEEPYAANASQSAEPPFTAANALEPGDLPPGEQEQDDLPAGEAPTNELPPMEDLFEDMSSGNDADELPPSEVSVYVLPDAEYGYDDIPGHEVVPVESSADEYSDDLPPAETLDDELDGNSYRNEYEYEYDYDYQCDCDEYRCYGGSCKSTTPASTADRANSAGDSLRPVLRTASWMLSQFGEALLGLSRSMDQMAEAQTQTDDTSAFVPPEMDYPWPTILGHKPDRDQTPGL